MSFGDFRPVLLAFVCENKYLNKLLPFYKIVAIIYAAWRILYAFGFSFGIGIGTILELLCMFSCIIAVARDDMRILMVVFGITALSYLLLFFTQNFTYGINYCNAPLLAYLALTYLAMVRFNKSNTSIDN